LTIHIDSEFYNSLLEKEGVEYGVFDSTGVLISHSKLLKEYLINPGGEEILGQSLNFLLPELVGYEENLDLVKQGFQDTLQIERIHRYNLFGHEGYVTLRFRPKGDGLLLVVNDVTTEGHLAQKITQQRNELSLVSDQLATARAELDHLLRQFVPTAVVDDMLSDSSKSQLGGERREITVMFADLRGFTPWSETHDPETVMDVLNGILSSAVEIILESGAILDKFMGDALMAIFNAPNQQDDHATQAIQCAQKICTLDNLNQKLQFGIGINTGIAVVGNIGNIKAMNYTAIGDTVNVAKRIEEQTTSGQILIGERTHQLASPEIYRTEKSRIKLRGREKEATIYQVHCGNELGQN
jgi:class 3 adenylate cyclase